jgi:hypothetical protein
VIAELRPIAGFIGRSEKANCVATTPSPVLTLKTDQANKIRMWVVIRDGRPY